ncbi:MAG TPA: hypothetical protein VMU61_08065 [Candidatus Aquilonibacter sp.]|nr:hypothetical protein [Candidatus Aquilonibacter sp.]
MRNANAPTLRRSSRVPVTVPILVTSLAPGANFSEVCETMVVSAHGCSMRSPARLEAGVPLHFHNQDGRETTAEVVYCQPIDSDGEGWRLGARFDHPENYWGLKSFPKDWARLPAASDDKPGPQLVAGKMQVLPPDHAAASARFALDRIHKQLSDEHLKTVLAELVQPLQAEIADLRARFGEGAKRNRFEVSLSQIPPELEQQLEQRLKKELGPQVLREARDQSEQVLHAAKTAIEQKTKETHDQFLQRVLRDLQAVEQRTKGMATDHAQNLREHLNRGLGELHQEVVDAGNRLKKLSEDLLKVMQHNLGEEHDLRRRELEKVQAKVTSESARLQAQIGDLDRRMAALGESARQLESGLDQRLSRLASETVRNARAQLESALEAALNELSTRNAQELANQLDEASTNLKIIQKGIEGSVSESLRLHSAEALQSFEQSMEELAQQSVESWRAAFAGGLNSLVRTLGEQFILQSSNGSASQTGANEKARTVSSRR